MSGAVREALGDGFLFESRGPIQVKGVGRLETWLLKQERGPGPSEKAARA